MLSNRFSREVRYVSAFALLCSPFKFRYLTLRLLTLAISGLPFYFRGLNPTLFRNGFTLSQVVDFFFRVSSILFKESGDVRVGFGFRFGSCQLRFD